MTRLESLNYLEECLIETERKTRDILENDTVPEVRKFSRSIYLSVRRLRTKVKKEADQLLLEFGGWK